MQPPIPANEEVRVSALHALNVLDTAPEADFDDIVILASEICGAPISLVTLVDTKRQWFKAKFGMDSDETDREVSFCAHAIMGRDLMVVPDATTDIRFADNPYVQHVGGIRFYAGAPLVTTDGYALGTLCVVDHVPHRLSLDQTRALRALARQVVGHLELRRISVVPDVLARSEPRAVDLTYLVEGRIRELRPIADARNTVITLAVSGLTTIRADPQRLAEALDYVVFTALKAAPAGGRVAVRVSDQPSPCLEISHAGGSIMPTWQADLAGKRAADEPLPAAAAAVLRAHNASVETTSEPLGSPDVRFRIRFPSY
jgi:GAF domain-containing protein